MRLPSFSNLVAFDAVARHGTLTRAAAELNVSQPAISRRIAALEADLGCRLFDRGTKPLSLTRHGDELFEVLRTGLSRLEAMIERIRSEAGTETVTISAASGIAAYWLIPRLPAMQAAYPRLKLRIVSQSHAEDEALGDLQIRFGGPDWPGMTAVKLFGETVFAACSPLYAAGRPLPFDAETLQAAELIDMNVDRQPWYTWESWFEAIGRPVDRPLRITWFDSYALVVSAALAGQGICLCWTGLLDAYLESGALLRVSAASASSERGYFVTYPAELPPEAPARSVADWLLRTRGALG
jgi:DNA-binding transcriptional LysR family regulator